MSTKACPYCGETIQAVAVKCRFCNESLVDDDRGPPARPSGGGGGAIVVIVVAVSACALLGFAAVIAAVALPNLVSARKSGNEACAIGQLKMLTTAQCMHLEADKDGDGVRDYGSLGELGKETLIDPVIAGGQKQGYAFTCGTGMGTGPDGQPRFAVSADPVTPGQTGDRYFGVDETGQLYYSMTGPFTTQAGVLGKPPGANPVGR